MGNILFIRVSAVTYDEASMRKAWPGLYALCFSEDNDWAFGAGEKTVMDLITALDNGVRYSDMDKVHVEVLQHHAPGLMELKNKLDMALANHDVPSAKELANAIENALGDAEKALRYPGKK